ncbi:MAG: pilin [Candidatus Moraniibacteriota bacterium]
MNNSLIACTNGVCGLCDLLKVAESIFFGLLSVAVLLAVLFAIISGFLYLSSFGNEVRLKMAKEAFKYCLVGFCISLGAWLTVHSLYALLGYKGGSWWQIECVGEDPSVTQPEKNKTIYPNEVLPDENGGRGNPISLPDLAKMKPEELPENKYFFIHGLGGQPILNAAKQLASIAEAAKKQGKLLYAVIPHSVLKPQKNQVTSKDKEYELVDLTELAGPTTYQTQKNLQGEILDLIARSPSSRIPLIMANSKDDLPQFSKIWPTDINLSAKLIKNNFTTITPEGVIYEENKVFNEEEDPGSSTFTINLSYDAEQDKYYLDQEKPVSFEFPQDVSVRSAKVAASEVAQTLAQSAMNSYYKEEDEWASVAELVAKYSDATAYSPGAFPTGVVRDLRQPTNAKEHDRLVKGLEEDAAVIINNELRGVRKGANIKTTKNDNSQDISVSKSQESEYRVSVITPTEFTSTLEEVEKLLKAIPNYKISDLKARISTNRILGLPERENLKALIESVQGEIAYISGINLNIAPDFIMCIFNKETGFDAGAVSVTGCSGLGQLSMNAAKAGMQEMKKYAPKHFKALSEKVNKDWSESTESSIDMETTFEAQGNTDFKRVILRSDSNLNAAFATGFLDYIRRGRNGKGQPVSSELDLRKIAVRYGPGNMSYPDSIMVCYRNKGWRTIRNK